jgi:hypothetical protein
MSRDPFKDELADRKHIHRTLTRLKYSLAYRRELRQTEDALTDEFTRGISAGELPPADYSDALKELTE